MKMKRSDQMKAILAGILTFIMIISPFILSCAEILCDCSDYPCSCFIQLGDEGIAVKGVINLLNQQGYLSSRGQVFDREVYEAVCLFQLDHHIIQSGVFDDETLSILISGRVQSAESDEIRWVPTDGGKKYHLRPTCSGMYDPRKISLENAEALGIEGCKRCNNQK